MAGYIMLYHAMGNGLVLTDDSFVYLEKANVFAEKRSFRALGFTTFFPFQSLQIYILYLLGEKWSIGIQLLNTACWTGTILTYYFLARRTFKQPAYAYIFLITLTFSTPLIMVHSFLWTEPLFILLVSLQILLIREFILSKHYYLLIPLLLLSLLYCWQRKAGMVFSLAVIVIMIHLLTKNNRLKIILYSLITISILILYGLGGIIPNQIGELPDLSSITINLHNYQSAISAWILPFPLNVWFRIFILVLIVSLIIVFFRKIKSDVEQPVLKFVRSLVIIFVLYLVIRHFFHRLHFHEADRFLAPIYPIFFFLIIFVIDRITLLHFPKKLAYILLAVTSIWLAYPIVRSIKNADLWHNHPKKSLAIKASSLNSMQQ